MGVGCVNKQTFMRQWCMTDNTPNYQLGKSCSNQDCRIILKYCNKLSIINRIIKNYHSYRQNTAYCGKRFDWLIYNNNKVVGLIGIGSPPMCISKSLMDYLGLKNNNLVQSNIYKKCAVNWRFTLMPTAPKNAASQSLKLMIQEAKILWKKEYGENLLFLFTFVLGKKGTLYKASGWDYVGRSSGEVFKNVPFGNAKFKLSRCAITKSGQGIESGKKLIFIKPLHRYWRKELLNYTNHPKLPKPFNQNLKLPTLNQNIYI